MMSNIFSIFDPSSSPRLAFNWFSPMIIFLSIPFTYWRPPSRASLGFYLPLNFIFKESKILIKYSYSNLIIFSSMFMTIFYNNFMGLFPYIFPPTSHLSFTLSISLSLWLALISYNLFNCFNKLCMHLTPQGTPPVLMPFMVIIESISLFIRPITLSVRLAANMIAGHLLLSLTGLASQSMPPLYICAFILPPQTLLFSLELAVAIIQAYVFSVLIVLYSSET